MSIISTGQTIGEVSQDWQTSKTTIAERAKHLLKTGLFADCQFLVGADGSNQEVIKANKTLLGMSSPVFEAMLFGKMTGRTAVTNEELISIPDLTPASFKHLLQYVYTDVVDLQSMDQAMGLCYAAKKYILPDLVAKCFQYMMTNLGPEYSCRVLEFTNLFEDDNLKAKCISILREKTAESLAPPNFEELSKSTVSFIVKEEVLNIRELELFNAVAHWARYQCGQRDLEINGTNMRQMLGEIMNEIRFLIMKSEEFASTPSLSGILNQEECFTIFMNLNNPGSLPMPLHLSSCRNQRIMACFSRPVNGGRSTINEGIYCLRDVENEALILEEAFINKEFPFFVDRAIIFRGFVLAGMVIPDQQEFNGQSNIVIDWELLDHCNDTALASAKVSQPLTRHVTPISLEPVFNCSIHLQPNQWYCISVSVSQRAQFITGMASTATCQGVMFSFSSIEWDNLVRGLIFNLC